MIKYDLQRSYWPVDQEHLCRRVFDGVFLDLQVHLPLIQGADLLRLLSRCTHQAAHELSSDFVLFRDIIVVPIRLLSCGDDVVDFGRGQALEVPLLVLRGAGLVISTPSSQFFLGQSLRIV